MNSIENKVAEAVEEVIIDLESEKGYVYWTKDNM